MVHLVWRDCIVNSIRGSHVSTFLVALSASLFLFKFEFSLRFCVFRHFFCVKIRAPAQVSKCFSMAVPSLCFIIMIYRSIVFQFNLHILLINCLDLTWMVSAELFPNRLGPCLSYLNRWRLVNTALCLSIWTTIPVSIEFPWEYHNSLGNSIFIGIPILMHTSSCDQKTGRVFVQNRAMRYHALLSSTVASLRGTAPGGTLEGVTPEWNLKMWANLERTLDKRGRKMGVVTSDR